MVCVDPILCGHPEKTDINRKSIKVISVIDK